MSENNVAGSTSEIVQCIARCLELPSDFDLLTDVDQLILQLYVGNIIKLPFKECGLEKHELISFLDGLRDSWMEAFLDLKLRFGSAPASKAKTVLCAVSGITVNRPKYVDIAIEKLIWIDLSCKDDTEAELLMNLLKLPTNIQNLFVEARNLLHSSEVCDPLRASFIFGSLLSQNTPSSILARIRGLKLDGSGEITTAALGPFWQQRTLPSLMSHSQKTHDPESTASYLLMNLSNVLPQLHATERLELALALFQFAVDQNLPLCDIDLVNISLPNNGTHIDDILGRFSSLPPWLRAAIKSANSGTPLQRIVSGPDTIVRDLTRYLGLQSVEQLDAHFVKCGMLKGGDSMEDTIRADLQCLDGIDHDILASRFESCIRQAWASHIRQVLRERDQDPSTASKIHPDYREYNVDILNEFSAHISDNYWLAERRNIVCAILVSGDHHRDPFHPFVDTFDLASDWVRGSSDVIIINTKLSTEFSGPQEQETLENLLAERYNSRVPASWESDPGVIYCSDMSPYLFRLAYLLQGDGCRYRIDPGKLCRVLGLINRT
eukprot:TRINITY_DN12502_c0_g1_i1.p1 TRINITY_DN12502_c0_g1~~TRINITY_DN12502_c0_g1_i1.p1  ORF type:complete len:550 (+),score=60.33 TRINITY_DN12502_c0_g1_i1:128-1777(+)